YCVATIALFAILMKMKDYTYDGFNGLGKKEPFLALVATICLLSLAGIPATAGFFAKYYMLSSVLEYNDQFMWLVVFGLLMAAVSVYYYFKVIMAMYFKQGEAEMVREVNYQDKLLLSIAAAIIIIIGLAPDMLLRWL